MRGLHRDTSVLSFVLVIVVLGACGPTPRPPDQGGDDNGVTPDGDPGMEPPDGCSGTQCSGDLTQVLDCDGNVLETCSTDQACGAGVCRPPCEAADVNHSSIGCDYYATAMAAIEGTFGGCFVAFVANTWHTPVQLTASWGTQPIDLAAHARIPRGSGPSVTYDAYDAVNGLPPGEVAILFLANDPVAHGTWRAPAPCPAPAAVGLDAHVHYGLNIDTGRTKAFHITADKPVVAYQMLPYNAAQSASTGATLLLPTSAWHTNYMGAMASRPSDFMGLQYPPSMAIVARDFNTHVTIRPTANIRAGIDVNPSPAGTPITYTMTAGQTIEFIQNDDLTGSAITSDSPIAVFAGHTAMRIPWDVPWSEHAEQQLPPVRALGSEYAVASYRDRIPPYVEKRRHRILGIVAGTQLTYEPPIPQGPATVAPGGVVEFEFDGAFVVKSQDKDHPFAVFTYMSGSENISNQGGPPGYGDADFVRVVPGPQYLKRYVFMADPTYPETNLVIVRRANNGTFADVTLDCAGVVSGWQSIATAAINGRASICRAVISRPKVRATPAATR